MVIILKALSAGIVSAAFAVLFQIRGRKIAYAALCGALGYLVYLLLYDINNLLAMFAASVVMALYSEIAARLFKSPATLFIIAGLIPIVPGGGMFSFVLKAMEGKLDEAASIGIMTLFEAGAIAGGIIMLSAISRMIFRIKKNPLSKQKM